MSANNFPTFNAAVQELTSRVEGLISEVTELESVTNVAAAKSSADAAAGSSQAAQTAARRAEGARATADAAKTAAEGSAGAAQTSATNSQAAAVASAASAAAAAGSASAAATSKAEAETAKASATASAATATTQATNSGNSATASANSATAASGSAAKAEDWASKTDGAVEGEELSAKQHALNAAAVSADVSARHADVTTKQAAAAASANNAKTSETNAGNSATAAATSAAEAGNSAGAAASSVSAAQEWATKTGAAVAGGEFSAKYHALAAAISATAASGSATAADSSKTAAASSATAASASATTANTSKNAAATSAANAAGSATAADSAKVAALAAQAAAEAARDEAAQSASVMTGALVELGAVSLAGGAYPAKPQTGAFWKVTAAGTVDSIDYGIGDTLVYSKNLDQFYKIDNTESVSKVNGKTGTVVLSAADVGALPASGTAAAADKLATPRTINGVEFDGSGNITITDATKEPAIAAGSAVQYLKGNKTWGTLATDVLAVALTGLSVASSAVVVATDNIRVAIGKLQAQITGLAASKLDVGATAAASTKLATPRAIGGVGFDGTAAIDLPGVNAPGNQSTTGNAATATKLAAARTIALTGDVTGSGSFDGSGNLSIAVDVSDNSHSHAIANITGLQAALNAASGLNQGALDQDPNAAVAPVILSNHANTPNSAYYWHITTTFYSEISATRNRGQIAVQYNGGIQVFARSCFSEVWTTWMRLDNSAIDAAALTSGIVPNARLSGTYTGVSITGNAATASKLATARTINGAAFDGTANITVEDATKLPLTGGTLTGTLTAPGMYSSNWYRTTGTTGWYSETYGGGVHMTDATWVRIYNAKALHVGNEIAATGNITAYYSDERLKENIQPITKALEAVLSLKGVRYNANALGGSFGYDRSKQEIGLLAQDVQKVAPEAVELAPFDRTDTPGESLTGEHYLTLKYERLVPLLVEALRELHGRVERFEEDRPA